MTGILTDEMLKAIQQDLYDSHSYSIMEGGLRAVLETALPMIGEAIAKAIQNNGYEHAEFFAKRVRTLTGSGGDAVAK